MPLKSPIIDQLAAKRLGIARKHLKLNQADFASAAGVDQSMISRMEKGTKEITFGVLKNLFISKNISPSYILANDSSIVQAKESDSLITNIRDLRAEIEVMKAELTAVKQNVRMLTNKEK